MAVDRLPSPSAKSIYRFADEGDHLCYRFSPSLINPGIHTSTQEASRGTPPQESRKLRHRPGDIFRFRLFVSHPLARVTSDVQRFLVAFQRYCPCEFRSSFEEWMRNRKGWKKAQHASSFGTKSRLYPWPQARHGADALAMIRSRMTGPLESLAVQPKIAFSTTTIRFPNWHRVKLAFLKSITTGVFIDVQLYAFNKICWNMSDFARRT